MYRVLAFLLCSFILGAQSAQKWTLPTNALPENNGHFISKSFTLSSEDYSFLGFSIYSFQEPALSVEMRFQTNGHWGPWQSLHQQAHNESITDRQVWVSELISLQVQAWQIRLKEKPIASLFVRLFKANGRAVKQADSRTEVLELEENSCTCPQPNYCDRSCWCPNGDCPPPGAYTPTVPTHLIVHHSAGANSSNDYPGVVAYYWDLHVNTNGWSDIGYNWLIDPNGQIYEGRGSGNTGAHFSCLNSGTLGICIIGDYRNTQPSLASLQSLSDLLLYESCLNGIVPADTSVHASSQLMLRHISGHRDANPATVGCPSGTVCPGQILFNKLDSIAIAINQAACLLSQNEFNANQGQHFYPVPSKDYINSESLEPISKCQIIDSQGRVFNLNKISRNRWDLRKFDPGIYTLHYLVDKRNYFQIISIL